MYFDLDVYSSCNPHISLPVFENLVTEFKKLVTLEVKELIAQQEVVLSNEETSQYIKAVIELDSTRKSKYSRHLIYTLDKFVFRNTSDLHYFVEQLRKKIDEDVHGHFPKIYHPKNKAGSKSEFLDLSIYSKNSNLRIVGSSKYILRGSNPLRLYDCQSKKKTNFHQLQFISFVNSFALHLVTSKNSCHMLKIPNQVTIFSTQSIGRKIEINDTSPKPHFGKRYKRSAPNLVFGKRAKKLKRTDSMYEIKNMPFGKDENHKRSPKKYPSQLLRGYFQTHVLKKWPRTNKSSKVTAVKQFGNKTVIGLSGVHFCCNVRREHRHNNVYFVFLPDKGTYTQKCHACTSYTSHQFRILIN